ncbi:MAG: hypothetical protein IT377_09245 [Polyangiaceae bacterium]|nr:hypothetical protein [Myxococcales bacterium]MCC6899148.1 hypothetical protein [Polyangiaceae bacterium]
MRFIRRSVALLTLSALGSAVGLGGAPISVARAQTAADKATARQLATEGIELYKAGKFSEALDKLDRAEQLYDAPVHLIYIARANAQLGQYVEAAEAYRRLVRTQLPDNAPAVFKEAVADAKKELPDVEPKIASLRVDVEPRDIKALKLEIDGAAVSSAALGVDRPANPGTRKITASAPGYKSVEQTLELKPGEKKKLALTLEPDPSGAAGGGEGGAAGGAGGASGDGEKGGSTPSAEPTGNFGFIAGLRLGAAIPVGKVAEGHEMKNYFGPGGGVEIRGGVRAFKRYSAVLLFGVDSYQPGQVFEGGPGDSVVEVVPQGFNAGVGIMYAPPPGTLGIIAELDFLPLHRFEAKRDVKFKAQPPPPDPKRKDCSQTLKAHGTAVRVSGGLQVPLTPWLQLSPYAGVAFGQLGDFSKDSDCVDDDYTWAAKVTPWHDKETPAQAGHVMVSLGVGGDILFGSDKPSK